KTKFTLQDYLWLAFNLMPLVLYLAGTFNALQAFLVYVAETIVVGGITLLKIVAHTLVKYQVARGTGKPASLSNLWFVIFFLLHYGIFVMVQFIIFMSAAGLSQSFNPIVNFKLAWQLLGKDGQLLFTVNAAIMLLYSATSFWAQRQYQRLSLEQIMKEPYVRIFIQQFTVILGAVFLSAKAGGIFLVVFMLAKIFFTSFWEYRSFETPTGKQR
ncbi:MAG TPA: DUF6498-containing protein, partial [Phnomibacter sp.]|nr:DUF6498-containing protein [Phnomibacter sp.]